MIWVVAALLHKYELAVLAVNVTLPPWQNVVAEPANMVGAVGNELTVTFVTKEVAGQPLALVTVTE